MTRLPRLCCALVLALQAATAVAATETPEQVIKATAEAVIQRVSAERDALRSDPVRLHSMVDEMIVPHFDFRRMAQWVLGKHWREASAEVQGQFVDEFKNLLIRTYATALLEYGNQTIEYFPAQESGNAVTLKTALAQPGTLPIPIVYRMHQKDGAWKVFDVSVDGVSLLTTYRASFSSEIRKNGIDALIADLASRRTNTAAPQ